MIDIKTKPEVFIDKRLVNSLDSQISNNLKTKTNMDSVTKNTKKNSFAINTLAAKIFEMDAGAISESILLQDENTVTNNFFEYEEYKEKDSILVLSDDFTDEEIANLETILDDNFHTVVYCGNNSSKFADIFKKIKTITTDSLTNAVTKAYQLVKEGQTIIFPKIDRSFEFFAHLNLA